MTDLAEHDPAHLAGTLLAEREAVAGALAATTGALGMLAAAIAAGDQGRLVTLLEEVRRVRRGSDR